MTNSQEKFSFCTVRTRRLEVIKSATEERQPACGRLANIVSQS